MDIDVFPNSIEYWGPNGMVFFRNVQLRWTPWSERRLAAFMVALERPGASADQGDYAGRIELQDVKGRFPLPDLSAHFRKAGDCGPRPGRPASCARSKWDDLNSDQFDLGGDATGWGLHAQLRTSSSPKHVVRRVGRLRRGHPELHERRSGGRRDREQLSRTRARRSWARPCRSSASSAFLDLNWNDEVDEHASATRCSTSTTSTARRTSAFKKGQYALANILYYPTPSVFLGPEIQWGKRENFHDGFSSDDFRDPVLGQVQLQALVGRQVMSVHEDGRRDAAAARRGRGRCSAVGAPAPGADAGRDPGRARRGLREVQGPRRKARTPTTSRRWPRSTRTSTGSRS